MKIENRDIRITELPGGASIEAEGEICQLILGDGGMADFQASELAELIEALQVAHRSMTGAPVTLVRPDGPRVLYAGDPEPEIGFRGHDKDGDAVKHLASGIWCRNNQVEFTWNEITMYDPITEEG